MTGEAAIREAAARIAAAGDSRPRAARDPVNLPMIRNWLEALSPAAPDPTAPDPTAPDPTVPDPTAQDPTAQDPTALDPAALDPAALDPAAPDPTAQDPAAQDPAALDPAAPDPTAPDPTAQDPAALDPVAPDPTDPQPPAGLTAPPAMIQVWTMPGLHGVRADDDPLGQMVRVLDQAGYTSVVATNCDQTYRRYLKLGEQLTVRARLLDVTGPKRTALGEGWFVTTRSTWFSSGEPVATMDFRILKFRPPQTARPQDSPPQTTPPLAAATSPPHPDPPVPFSPSGTPTSRVPPGTQAGPVMRPQVTRDTAFFWAGTAAGELRIQRCACGALRHPPGPMCPACGTASDGSYVVAAGTGEVFSYVVHHHPPVPGKQLPMVVALVQLPEGVRMVGEMPGVRPDQVRIGLPVRVAFVRVDDDLTLPAWQVRPGETTPPAPAGRTAEGTLPDRVIDVTPTFVISSALATRDFTDLHHDRDRAVEQGAKDIFVNILTTTGLVQRYVCDWAGPDAVVRAISIRLGVPCHAGDTLTLTGQVTASEGAERVVAVTGRCRLGDHVKGTVRIEVPP
jgi:uncharacterized protein